MGRIRVSVTGPDAALTAALTAYLAAQPTLETTGAKTTEVTVVISPPTPESIIDLAVVSSVLVLGPDDPQAMIAGLEAGALGYLPETAPFGDVAAGVEAVAAGEAVVPPLMLGSLLRHVVRRRRAARADLERLATLTERERQVFDLLAEGHDRAAIAQSLYISVGTVRSHLQRMFRKLDVHTHADVVGFAARCGLLASDNEEPR